MGKCWNMRFYRSFEDFGLKTGTDIHCFLNEYMKICEYVGNHVIFYTYILGRTG